jgi:membrane-associated phospholipid phosphatase
MVGFAATTAGPVAAQTTSQPSSKSLFTWQDAAMMGGFVIATAALAPVDVAIANRLRDTTVQENRVMSMYGYGRLARDKKAASLGLHGTEALLIGQLAGTTLKGLFGRERPFVKRDPHSYKLARGFARGSERFRSMPSGHTISAFAAAAAVTSETRRWWPGSDKYIGPLMYGGAALAGISRIYHNRHWATDVMMGAAIGTMAGIKVVRYSHAHPTNAIDRWLLSGSASRDASGKLLVRWSVMPVLGQ